MAVDERDYPPLKCDCGCENVHKNEQYQGDDLVEYDLYCGKCGKYLGHFTYGSWTY